MRLFLNGFMGCGKSHYGKELAGITGYSFIDLDNYIARTYQKSIFNLFKTEGEASFRKIEYTCLRNIELTDNQVIALGGGTPCYSDNMEWINLHGTSIYLRATNHQIFELLSNDKTNRPLICGLNDEQLSGFIEKEMKDRTFYYLKSHYTFDISDDLVTKIIETLLL